MAAAIALGAVLLVVATVHVLALRSGHAWGDDFAQYLMHARNLAEGRPYAATGYVYNPQEPAVGPPTYPPGTAVILAPVYRLFGLNFTAMKAVMIACLLFFLGMVFLAFREDLSLPDRLVLLLLLGLNPFVLEQSNQIGSHLPFLALLYLAMLLLGQAENSGLAATAGLGATAGLSSSASNTAGQASSGTLSRYLWFLAAGVVCYLAFATRTLGALLIVALWAAWAAELIRTRRIDWPAFLAMVTATVAFAALAACQAVWLHSDVHYLDQFHSGLRLAGNVRDYSNRLAAFWHNGYWRLPSILLCLAVTALALLGYVQQLRRRITFRELFTAGYVAVLLLWPSYQGEHYLLPVYPLYLFYAFLGLRHPWLARRLRLQRAITGVLVLAIAVTYGIRLGGLKRSPLPEGIAKHESQELFETVRSVTRPGDLMVFVKPRALALFTGRPSMSYHQAKRDEDLWDDLRQHGASWLVVVENDEALLPDEKQEKMLYLRQFVQRNPTRLKLVYRNRDFSLYAIRWWGTRPLVPSGWRAYTWGRNVPGPRFRPGLRRIHGRLAVMPTADEKYDEAIQLKEGGKAEEAISKLRELLQEEPDYALAHSALAVFYSGLEQHDEAIEHARRVCELESDDPFSFVALSLLCQKAGLIAEAERALMAARQAQVEHRPE